MGGNSLTTTREAKFFSGGRLDVNPPNGNLTVFGNIIHHCLDMRRKLRFLTDNRRVQITNPVAA